MRSTTFCWAVAIVVTLAAAVFQRKTGPTYPRSIVIGIGAVDYKLKLPRSCNSGLECLVSLGNIRPDSTAWLHYRRYPTNEEWTATPFRPDTAGKYLAYLPTQPAAGKLEYFIEIQTNRDGRSTFVSKEEPIVIRFKDPVPAWALIPHVLAMFLAMLFSNLAGVMAIFRFDRFRFWGTVTIALLFLGGLVFGPIVQQYAFGQAWTGFPLGHDLTDNKTLIAFVAWLVAVLLNRKEERPMVTLFAALVTLMIFSIPHSLRGSELNYETGRVITGFMQGLTFVW